MPQSVVVAGQLAAWPQVQLPPGLGLPLDHAGPSKVEAQKVAAHQRLWVSVAAHWAAGRHLQAVAAGYPFPKKLLRGLASWLSCMLCDLQDVWLFHDPA